VIADLKDIHKSVQLNLFPKLADQLCRMVLYAMPARQHEIIVIVVSDIKFCLTGVTARNFIEINIFFS
jgi:hypothetical protein